MHHCISRGQFHEMDKKVALSTTNILTVRFLQGNIHALVLLQSLIQIIQLTASHA